jgi:hypothetical protein
MPSLARISPKSELAPIAVDWELAFTRAPTKKALVYWRSLCRGRAMPARSELSPRAMQEFLPHVSVVDIVPDRVHGFEYIVSLQGRHPTEVLGNVKGRRLGDIFSQELAERWRGCFEPARAAAAPVRLLTRASTLARNWLACEVLIAPLGDGAGNLQSLFWVFAAWRAE